MWCYIGTTASDPPHQAKGIYRAQFDPASGTLTEPILAAEIHAPSFLALHPNGRFLYSCRESASGMGAASFSVDRASGKLKRINEQPSGGKGNCFVDVDSTGKALLVANYQNGSFAALPIAADGSIGPPAAVIQDQGGGPFAGRQDGPHAHSFNVDPTNRFVIGCDLGNDQLPILSLDPAMAGLVPVSVAHAPPGHGPRHLAFGRDQRFIYLANELSSTITVFSWNAAEGSLKQVQDLSALPSDFSGESWSAEVAIGSDGKFLYISNRGHDSIGIFAIDSASGQLSLRGFQKTGGKWPRHFAIDPSGQWLIAANEHTHDLFVFRIDSTGGLTPTSGRIEVPSPSCVLMLR